MKIELIPSVARVLVEYERLYPKKDAREMFDILVNNLQKHFSAGRKLRVGDAVKFVGDGSAFGRIGYIRHIESPRGHFAVDFGSQFSEGHNCNGYCPDKQGRWCLPEYLIHAEL